MKYVLMILHLKGIDYHSLMIIIVFLFHYRGEHEHEHAEHVECDKHVGPVDPVGPVIRCQCYQH